MFQVNIQSVLSTKCTDKNPVLVLHNGCLLLLRGGRSNFTLHHVYVTVKVSSLLQVLITNQE